MHLNKYFLKVKKKEYLGIEIDFVVFIKNWKFCIGWETVIEGETYGHFLWLDSLEEALNIGQIYNLLYEQARNSIVEIVKIRSRV